MNEYINSIYKQFPDNNNFLLYCAKSYDNFSCSSLDEFYNDLQNISAIKKILRRYKNDSSDSFHGERILVNKFICFFNVYSNINTACKILFYKIEPDMHDCLLSVLVYLERLPLELHQYKNQMNYGLYNILKDRI